MIIKFVFISNFFYEKFMNLKIYKIVEIGTNHKMYINVKSIK